MKTQVEGLGHFSKTFRFLFREFVRDSVEVDEETFKNYMSNFNYLRDWWWDCVLYREGKYVPGFIKFKDVSDLRILGFIVKATGKYYITEE